MESRGNAQRGPSSRGMKLVSFPSMAVLARSALQLAWPIELHLYVGRRFGSVLASLFAGLGLATCLFADGTTP
jgi:hypothetical protein